MVSLEEKLRPRPGQHDRRRDMLGLGLLAALAFVLVAPAFRALQPASALDMVRTLHDLAMQLASPLLLPALGFLLALRAGAIDLSVWLSAAAGGVVAALLIRSGQPPALALPAGVAAGAALGAINAVLVIVARIPSVIATIAVAFVGVFLAAWIFEARTIGVPDGAFARWHLETEIPEDEEASGDAPENNAAHRPPTATNDEPTTITYPLSVTRILLVVAVHGLVMLVLLTGHAVIKTGTGLGLRRGLAAALCASGALSAAGGALWLMEYGAAPVPTRPIGDLRVPAAAILAGGLMFTGRGRSLLAGLCLPIGMLVATRWRMGVWALQVDGYALEMILLTAMTLVAHAVMVHGLCGRHVGRPLPVAAAAMTAVGLLVLAGAAGAEHHASRQIYHVVGLATWTAGALLAAAHKIGDRLRVSAH